MAEVSIQQALQMADEHRRCGDFVEAENICRTILQKKPDHPAALNLLGIVARQTGRNELAIELIKQAIALKADVPSFYNSLANALHAAGQDEPAVAAYCKTLELKPDQPPLWNQLAELYCKLSKFDQSIECWRNVLKYDLTNIRALNSLANALKDRCKLDEAIQLYRRAMAADPDNSLVHSNLIYTLYFHPDYDLGRINQEHAQWNRRFADHVQANSHHQNDRDPGRKLRIGYVSPDFRRQSECFFVVPLFEQHDPNQFETHAYASVRQPDNVTELIKRTVNVWHDVTGMPNDQLAEKIREDRIDILIDLTMHMADNRLPLMARKPAPVQVTWLAYPGTTGLPAIDYRLTDPYLEPADQADEWSAEQPIRLPDSWCCYDPLWDAPEVNELPAAKNGFITFGSLNNFCKINERVLELWARVMDAVKDSRLILLSQPGSHWQRVFNFFEAKKIASNRIEFSPLCPRKPYLELYHRIDIGLDPFPYNGITTTCDALLMGVPVVTLQGKLPAARAGLSLLANVGLTELAAASQDDYLKIAHGLAADLPRLSQLRQTLREQMRTSSLMHAAKFARDVESAYRTIWRKWCGQL